MEMLHDAPIPASSSPEHVILTKSILLKHKQAEYTGQAYSSWHLFENYAS